MFIFILLAKGLSTGKIILCVVGVIAAIVAMIVEAEWTNILKYGYLILLLMGMQKSQSTSGGRIGGLPMVTNKYIYTYGDMNGYTLPMASNVN